eukprot:IDg3471t1
MMAPTAGTARRLVAIADAHPERACLRCARSCPDFCGCTSSVPCEKMQAACWSTRVRALVCLARDAARDRDRERRLQRPGNVAHAPGAAARPHNLARPEGAAAPSLRRRVPRGQKFPRLCRHRLEGAPRGPRAHPRVSRRPPERLPQDRRQYEPQRGLRGRAEGAVEGLCAGQLWQEHHKADWEEHIELGKRLNEALSIYYESPPAAASELTGQKRYDPRRASTPIITDAAQFRALFSQLDKKEFGMYTHFTYVEVRKDFFNEKPRTRMSM